MKEKEREKKKGERKKGVKKKVPMRESNPRPLNLQTLKKTSVAIVSLHMRIYDQTSRIYIYISQI